MTMHIDDFRRAVRETANSQIASFVESCRRRFINSALLLEIRSPTIEKLMDSCGERVELWPLLKSYETLMERYADLYFTSQLTLFYDPKETPDMLWYKYFHHVLVPTLLQRNDIVRNVLKALSLLPCESSKTAADALVYEFSELTLPTQIPPWAPEDKYF